MPTEFASQLFATLEERRFAGALDMVLASFKDEVALGEPEASYKVFAKLHASAPEAARRTAYIAMPSVVAAGDYALATQYLVDPMKGLSQVNEVARSFPLFPAGVAATRVAASGGS